MPFPWFYFPLLPHRIHLPHNEIQEHLLEPLLSKQAGLKVILGFQPAGSLVGFKSFEVTPSQFPMSRVSQCTELQTLLAQWVLFQQHPAKWILTNWKLVGVGEGGWFGHCLMKNGSEITNAFNKEEKTHHVGVDA